MDRFRNEDKADYLNICRELEVKKREIRPDSTVQITFRIPLPLVYHSFVWKGTLHVLLKH
jgi:hypothetical protein